MQNISVLYLSKVSRIPGLGQRAHTHNYWHFSLRLRGGAKLENGTSEGKFVCYCYPPGTINPYSICSETSLGINVMFLVHDKRMYRKLEAFPFASLNEEALHIPLLNSIVEQIYELKPNQDFIDSAFSYYLHLLLATRENTAEALPYDTSLIERALSYIEKNYAQHIKVEDVAAHIGRSVNYTSYLIKSATNMTVIEHLREIRVKNACNLLAYSNASIQEIVSACGFISPSYFYRTFREVVGTTPTLYRTSHVVTDTFYDGEESALDVPYQDILFTYIPNARKCAQWKTPREYLLQKTSQL